MPRVELRDNQQFTFEGNLVCDWQLGPDLAKTWEKLKECFTEDGETETILAHRGGRVLAFLLYCFDADWGIERIVVVGVTKKGYTSSPVLFLENDVNGGQDKSAYALNYRNVPKLHDFWSPWSRLVDVTTGKADEEQLWDFAFLAEGDGYPAITLNKHCQPADWRRRTKLFSRWGLEGYFEVKPLTGG